MIKRQSKWPRITGYGTFKYFKRIDYSFVIVVLGIVNIDTNVNQSGQILQGMIIVFNIWQLPDIDFYLV